MHEPMLKLDTYACSGRLRQMNLVCSNSNNLIDGVAADLYFIFYKLNPSFFRSHCNKQLLNTEVSACKDFKTYENALI